MTTWLLVTLLAAAQGGAPSAEALFEAARSGDRARVAQLLDAGVDVNARARYDVTALGFAADKGHLDVVRLLVERGADLTVQDTFYRTRAIDRALGNRHFDVALYLLERGSPGAQAALTAGIRAGHVELVKAALATDQLDAQALASAAAAAKRAGNAAVAELVNAAAAAKPVEEKPAVTVPAAVLQSYAGAYRNEGSGVSVTVAAGENALTATAQGQPAIQLTPTSETSFAAIDVPNLVVSFGGRGGMVESMTVNQGGQTMVLQRLTDAAPTGEAQAAPTRAAQVTPTREAKVAPTGETRIAPTREANVPPRAKAAPWPGFRGANAAGVADGQGAVAEFDAASGHNVRWKTPIPGIAVSSPIVWGDRVFVTTAIGSGDQTFRTGLYGDVRPLDDLSEHTWRVYAVHRDTGRVLWQRDVFRGAPKTKRHTKSSQASSTPVTDGRRVVAVFGAIGLLVCYDMDGTLLWQRDLGVLDSGWFLDPTYQWGHSSSPIIYKNSVILQADQQQGSYLAAFDLATGKPLWKTERPDEIPTWGTPTVLSSAKGDELVTNGTKIRAYDPATGALLWTLGPNSEITVGTPVAGKDVVFVTGGYPPVRPVYAVKAGARGEIAMAQGEMAHAALAWSNDREGTYIPTPLLYRDILYTLNINGILTAYNAATGERLYRARVGGGGAFAASPVAADGRLYFASEDGDVFVAQAGPEYVELGKYSLNEVIMATPAISDGVIVIRTLGHLYGIGATDPASRTRTPGGR